MPVSPSTQSIRRGAVFVLSIAAAWALGPTIAVAHEDHAPLPTKGVTIAGDNVLLSDKAREAIGLTTSKVALGDLHRTVEVNARVELPWRQQAMITSLVPGRIEQVAVRPGETVTAGQELARVASMELESLQLTMLQVANDAALAERVLAQHRGLDAEGAIAAKTLQESEVTLAHETAELHVAEEKLRALGIDDAALSSIRTSGQPIAFLPITSPITGVVTHADVRKGQTVQTTDHLYHVVDPTRLWIVGDVLESDVRHLDEGQPVVARFGAFPDRQFDGLIDHVRLRMDRRRRTQSVVIAVENPDGLLRPGMFGRVAVSVRVAKQAIVCPADAIIKSRTGRYVLVQRKPGKYENRRVQLGLTRGKQVEVLAGLFPGDRVVVTGAYLLASLLGNEHKARTSTAGDVADESDSSVDLIAMADATVELPTDRQAFAGPRIEGRIRAVHVEPSQMVDAGDVLAEVDCLETRTVQLDLLQAHARLRLAEKFLARLEPLSQSGIAPQRRIWDLQNQRASLLHQIGSLKRQLYFFGLTDDEIGELERVDLTLQDADVNLLATVPIRAPASGWVVGHNVIPGQVAGPEAELFEIHDLSKVWIKGYVFERDAARVAIGQAAHVTFSAFPDLEAIGKVVRIAPMMDDSERVLPVWVEVDNPDGLLKEGMLARVAVLATSPNDVGETAGRIQLRPAEPRR